MNKEIYTINVGDMHFLRAEKIIKPMIKNGSYKDFSEPTFLEKVKWFTTEIVIAISIALYLNIHLYQ